MSRAERSGPMAAVADLLPLRPRTIVALLASLSAFFVSSCMPKPAASLSEASSAILAVGQGGTLLQSADRGRTWEQDQVGWDGDLLAVDARRPWVGGDGMTLRKAEGEWRAMPVPGVAVRGLSTVGGSSAWAVSEGGVALRVEPVGLQGSIGMPPPSQWRTIRELRRDARRPGSWRTVSTQSLADLRAVAALKEGTGAAKPPLDAGHVPPLDLAWAVGASGTVLRTENGGQSWVSQRSGTDLDLHDIAVHGPSRAVVVGEQGLVLRTSNAGRRWSSTTQGSDTLLAVDWKNDVLVAVGENGSIATSRDGGRTWTSGTSSSSSTLRGVAVLSVTEAVAVGDDGVILLSTDAGATWTAVESPTSETLTAVGAVN